MNIFNVINILNDFNDDSHWSLTSQSINYTSVLLFQEGYQSTPRSAGRHSPSSVEWA